MKRSNIVPTVFAGLALMAAAACASAPGGERVQVVVQNDNVLDVNVEVGEEALWERLGTVSTAQTMTFTVPDHVRLEDFRVRLDPIGSEDTFTSDEVLVSRGQTVMVEVPQALNRVAVSVY